MYIAYRSLTRDILIFFLFVIDVNTLVVFLNWFQPTQDQDSAPVLKANLFIQQYNCLPHVIDFLVRMYRVGGKSPNTPEIKTL